jgi:methionyl-tRNA formyltransferase
MKLVFFGSPDFAIPALEKLNESHDITLVVTQPDRPKGRGRKTAPTPVKVRALELGLQVISPLKIKTGVLAKRLLEEAPDYMIVTAYGRILPNDILAIPKFGSLNIHPSLLPLHRGPAPVNWTLINGDDKTGVTVMEITEKMDAGDIILVKRVNIDPLVSAGDLLNSLSIMGADLLVEILNKEEESKKMLPRTSQNEKNATYAPFIDSKTGKIDWSQSNSVVAGLMRGLDPRPGAFAFWGDKRIKLFSPRLLQMSGKPPGTILGKDEHGLIVSCGQGAVSIGELQLPGRKRLLAAAVLAGAPMEPGTIME